MTCEIATLLVALGARNDIKGVSLRVKKVQPFPRKDETFLILSLSKGELSDRGNLG